MADEQTKPRYPFGPQILPLLYEKEFITFDITICELVRTK